jgi:glycosyltransferase involved in cell wall biosynthesis
MQLFNPALGRRMLDRYLPELHASKVRSNLRLTLRSMRARKSFTTSRAYYDWYSQQITDWILARPLPEADVMFGFARNIHPKLLAAAKNRGLATIGDQFIAPYAQELLEELRQIDRFPGWSTILPPSPEDSCEQMEHETWKLLDHITCASDYVQDGLIRQGVSPERISVIPYPVDPTKFPSIDRRQRTGPITVGFVGAVGLRKGAPYFFQVAQKIKSPNVRFTMVGNVQLTEKALRNRGAVELPGPAARSEIHARLAQFDVFLFPSTCEGSAGAVIEAMCTGLPIVCSPNSGTVIRDGHDGFIRNYDDTDALADCIDRLAADPQLRLQMGQNSLAAAQQLTIDNYGQQIMRIIDHLNPHKKAG